MRFSVHTSTGSPYSVRAMDGFLQAEGFPKSSAVARLVIPCQASQALSRFAFSCKPAVRIVIGRLPALVTCAGLRSARFSR